jgi:rfaE bifunctional protein kinase chain/domain
MQAMIESQRARALVKAFEGKRILVVGDLMLDRYVIGTVARISPEAPVPVVQVTRDHGRPGGAANVALNIQSLSGAATVAGFLGRDAAGDDLTSLLTHEGISMESVVISEAISTTVKTRVMADRQQIVRVDREEPPAATAPLLPELCRQIIESLGALDGLIVEDYGKGVITQSLIDAVVPAALSAGIPVGLDPKDNHDLDLPGITLATPNYQEACAAANVRPRDLDMAQGRDEHLLELGRQLQAIWNAKFLAITLGAHGMYVLDEEHPPLIIPTQAQEVFDVSGAGDTVISTAILALAAGATCGEAVVLANAAAGVVVGKVGTAPCHLDELTRALP